MEVTRKQPTVKFVMGTGYGVDKYGRLYHYEGNKWNRAKDGKVLTSPDGYKYFISVANSKTNYNFIHRAVAQNFIARKPDGWRSMVVNHKDGRRDNNYVYNLEWVTQSENLTKRKPYTRKDAE